MKKYYCQGMKFYGDKIPLEFYDKVTDDVLFIGLYFQEDYDIYYNHKGKIIVFWNGSDVLRLLQNKDWQEIIKSKDAKHYCHNTQLQNELKSIGVYAEVIPLFFGNKEDYTNPIKVFMNAHPGRETEYGVPIVLELLRIFKDLEFHIYGINGDSKDNLVYHGQVPEQQMDNEIKHYQCCLRLNKHDGESQVIIKSKLLGLFTIISTDFTEIINKLFELKNKFKKYNYYKSSIKDITEFISIISESGEVDDK